LFKSESEQSQPNRHSQGKKSKKRKHDTIEKSITNSTKECIHHSINEIIKQVLSNNPLTLHKLIKRIIKKQSIGDKKLSKEQKSQIEKEVIVALIEMSKSIQMSLSK